MPPPSPPLRLALLLDDPPPPWQLALQDGLPHRVQKIMAQAVLPHAQDPYARLDHRLFAQPDAPPPAAPPLLRLDPALLQDVDLLLDLRLPAPDLPPLPVPAARMLAGEDGLDAQDAWYRGAHTLALTLDVQQPDGTRHQRLLARIATDRTSWQRTLRRLLATVQRWWPRVLAHWPLDLQPAPARKPSKPAPWLPLPAEENPALGVRGIRVGLRHRDVLDTQLRAILSAGAACRIMLPMVASVAELTEVRGAVERLRADMGGAHAVQVGVMVETPAAAITADLLARHADFLSIGTNDLTQYTLAMDRGNDGVAGGVDGLHPAVLRLIGETCRGAARHGRWTGVCGGLASDPLAVPILIGLGVTELSATPALVPEVKAAIRAATLADCRDLAARAVAADSAGAVRDLARAFARGMVAGETAA